MTPWYNENSQRSFPFLETSTAPLPEEAIVDFGCETGKGSGFVPGLHSVWLHRISRDAGVYTFTFRCDAPGLADVSLRFEVDASAAEYTSVRSTAGGGSSSETGGCGAARWSGFLVVGALTELGLSDGEDSSFMNLAATVEPAVIIDWSAAGIESVSLYNADRTKIPETVSCSSESSPEGQIYENASCLRGALSFMSGYNCAILQGSGDNSLTFGASVGAGEGEPCGEVPLFSSEESSASGPLGGGPLCGDVLRSINGIGGRILEIIPGNGVSVAPGAGENQLSIDIHLNGLAVCQTSSVSV